RSIQAQGIDPDIAFPVIYPGQDAPAERRSEADLPGALDVPNVAAETDTSDEEAATPSGDTIPEGDEIAGDTPLPVEPFLCEQPEEEDAEFRDCQLEKALEILADNAQYKQALAQAATVER
ncbi:MAG: peptidase S41, partial [Pseudomonadota bacterium]